MAKTRIYLDVDGVLNAIPAESDIVYRTGWPSFTSTRVRGFLITYAPDLLRALEDLVDRVVWNDDTEKEENSVEIVWLTTWRNWATEDLAPGIGLSGENWRVVSDGNGAHGYYKLGFSDRSYWWKVDALATDLIENPVDYVVWLDDDQPGYNNSVTSVVRKFKDTQFLTIAPYTTLGLTHDHIDLVRQFVARAEGDDGYNRFNRYGDDDDG